jgi:hypothetical protein
MIRRRLSRRTAVILIGSLQGNRDFAQDEVEALLGASRNRGYNASSTGEVPLKCISPDRQEFVTWNKEYLKGDHALETELQIVDVNTL